MGWQDRPYYREDGEMPRIAFPAPSVLTITLIVACLTVFLIQAIAPRGAGHWLLQWGSLSFYDLQGLKQPWRLITYQYLHGSGTHIFFNLLTLYFFLPPLERMWGWKKTLAFYTGGGIAAGVVYGIMAIFMARLSLLIGASGSILAAIGACAYFFPERQVFLFIFLVPIRLLAILLGVLYVLTIVGDRNVADAAHLGGMVYGFAAPWAFGPMWNRFQRRIQVWRMRLETAEEEYEQAAVDRILDKVHAHGMHSLTWRERRILRKATERQRQRDLEMGKRRGY